MGNEYKLKFRHENLADLDTFLRGLPNFKECIKDWYDYRRPENPSSWPYATIRIVDDGLYFNDHNNMSWNERDILIEQVKQKYKDLEVDDWEP